VSSPRLKGYHNSHPENSHIPRRQNQFCRPSVPSYSRRSSRSEGDRIWAAHIEPDTTTALKSDASPSEQAFCDHRNVFGEPGEEDQEMCPTIQTNDPGLSESAELRRE